MGVGPLPLSTREVRAMAAWLDRDSGLPQRQQDIGDRFGVSRSAIAMRIKRGREKLRAAHLPIPDRPRRRRVLLAQLSTCAGLAGMN